MTGVRRAVPADAPTVVALLRELAEHQGEARHVACTADRWAELLGRSDVVVVLAEDASGPTGYASALRRPHFWSGGEVLALDDVYVREAARGAGTGRDLMLALAAVAATDRLVLRWEVAAGNDAALRFYRRLGAEVGPKWLVRWLPEAYRPLLGDTPR